MLANIVTATRAVKDFVKTYSGYAATLEPVYLRLVSFVQANPKTATTTLLIAVPYGLFHIIF